MRGPSSSPSHPSMSPSLPLNSCFHLLSCSIISSLQSSPPSRHFHLLLSSLRPLNTVTVRLGVAVTSPLLTHLRFHLLTSPVRFWAVVTHMGTFTDSFNSSFLQGPFPPMPPPPSSYHHSLLNLSFSSPPSLLHICSLLNPSTHLPAVSDALTDS